MHDTRRSISPLTRLIIHPLLLTSDPASVVLCPPLSRLLQHGGRHAVTLPHPDQPRYRRTQQQRDRAGTRARQRQFGSRPVRRRGWSPHDAAPDEATHQSTVGGQCHHGLVLRRYHTHIHIHTIIDAPSLLHHLDIPLSMRYISNGLLAFFLIGWVVRLTRVISIVSRQQEQQQS